MDDWILIVGCLAVLAAIYGVHNQIRHQRLQASADSLNHLLGEWDKLHSARSDFASMLKHVHTAGPFQFTKEHTAIGHKPVLSFFEHLAMLTRRGVLDKEMTWIKFGDQVCKYFFAAQPLIEAMRTEWGRTYYEEFEWLHRLTVRQFWLVRVIRVPLLLRRRIFALAQLLPLPTSVFVQQEIRCVCGLATPETPRRDASAGISDFLDHEMGPS